MVRWNDCKEFAPTKWEALQPGKGRKKTTFGIAFQLMAIDRGGEGDKEKGDQAAQGRAKKKPLYLMFLEP